MFNGIKKAFNYLKEKAEDVASSVKDFFGGNQENKVDLEDKEVLQGIRDEGLDIIQGEEGKSGKDYEVKTFGKKKSTYVTKVPRYHLNRKMRRFLRSMGWGKINPRSTTPNMWWFIHNLMNAKLKLHKKREIFHKVMGN